MANDYEGSLAQQYVTFDVAVTKNAALGVNFQSVMIFMPDDVTAANFTGTAPSVGGYASILPSTYADLTEGTLKAWLDDFYASNALTEVFVVVYDHATASYGDLTIQFNKYKQWAYFKLMFGTVAAAQVALADLCDGHPYSQCWIGTADAECLTEASTTSIAYLLRQAAVNPHLEYHATAANSAMAQLGLSLGVLNGTGYSVGNSLDYKATNVIDASGTAGANLSAAQVTALKNQKIGYWATVGDNTGNVAQYGGRTIRNDLCGAEWFVAFIEYMCSALGANYLTDPTANRFRNNDTYQSILSILKSQVQPFVDIGKISNFKVTAPPFSKLVDTGDSFIVPNAWTGDYNDNLRSVTVQGVLSVTV